MKITTFRAENFKRLQLVEINPDGSVVQITGRNASGKSSVLDGLYERIALDPLAFLNASADKQRELFADACGITAELTALHAQYDEAYDRRRDANRILRDRKSNLLAEPKWDAAVPADEIPSNSEAVADLDLATMELATFNEYEQQIKRAERNLADNAARREQLEGLLADLAQSDADVQKALQLAKKENEGIDPAVLQRTIDDCRKRLELVGLKERHDAALEAARASQAALAAATTEAEITAAEVARLAREQAELVAEASPIDGLSLNQEGDLVWNGLPVDQASQAERVMISCQMAIAADPQLKVLLVRDGNLLDASMLEQLCETARENDMQVWIELVADEGEVGIYLEDGEVVNA